MKTYIVPTVGGISVDSMNEFARILQEDIYGGEASVVDIPMGLIPVLCSVLEMHLADWRKSGEGDES